MIIKFLNIYWWNIFSLYTTKYLNVKWKKTKMVYFQFHLYFSFFFSYFWNWKEEKITKTKKIDIYNFMPREISRFSACFIKKNMIKLFLFFYSRVARSFVVLHDPSIKKKEKKKKRRHLRISRHSVKKKEHEN